MVIYPQDWQEKKFVDFMKIKRGASPRPIENYITSSPYGVNWIKIGDAPRYKKNIVSTKEKITAYGAAHSVRVFVGDFLLSNSMSFGRPYILGIDGCIHDGWLRLYEFQADANNDFLYYLLSSSYVQKQYETYAAGSGVQNLNKEVVKKVSVFLPHMLEQEVIAETLSSFDTYIDNLTELIEKKRNIRDGALEDLVSGRTRLDGYRDVWHRKSLGELGMFSKGQGISRNQANSGNIPCVRYGEIYTHYNIYVKETYSHISYVVAAQSVQIHRGDLLMTASGETKDEIGKCVVYYNDREAYAGGDIIIMHPSAEIDSLFLSFLLNSKPLYSARAQVGQGDAVVHISAKSLKSINISYPSDKNEQRNIAQVLLQMDKEIEALENECAKIIQIREGAMDDLLTGRVRLKV